VHCAFQRLDGLATHEGLWISSTVPDHPNERFRVKAVAVGRKARAGSPQPAESACGGPSLRGQERLTRLSATGDVSVEGQTVRFTRPGLVEEYTVSMDGVQQDFLVSEKPGGAGVPAGRLASRLPGVADAELRVELVVAGAGVEQTPYGAQLVLEPSGRRIAYTRLKATDARAKELPARMEVAGKSEIIDHESEIGLAVVVDDANAVYPVRIDPTFSDANWISLGGLPVVNGVVLASAVDGAGNLYIGGEFTLRGVAANIAKWNGSTWSPLGSGLGGELDAPVNVWALTASGTNLYVGGNFTRAGGVEATNIAKWDGSAWSALGSGVGGGYYIYPPYPMVSSVAVSGSNVYAAGEFGIARWDGNNWSALGSRVNDMVWALAASGSNLYAGGAFTKVGGIAANGIAKWDGSAWSALGLGVNGGVVLLAVLGGDLYAGGGFTNAGGIAANAVAKWDGSAWSALGSGLDGWVTSLAVSDGGVYAGGGFTNAGGVAATNVAKWNGSAWSALGSGVNRAVRAVAVSGTNVYAVAPFMTAGGTAANEFAKWDGRAWSTLGLDSDLGLGGARFPSVEALAVSGSDLYVGGEFTTAGGIAANYIAKWNGSTWSALGSGMNNTVMALAVAGGDLYAGGSFTVAGGVAANCIAKWNGSAWSALGSGMGPAPFPSVMALAVSGSNVYAGGLFTTAGGIAANNIAKWDGNAWTALGSGVSGPLHARLVSGSDVCAGGQFTIAGGSAANYIAKWNGSAWSALGSGMGDVVVALAFSGNELYAGGYFTTAGGSAANYIAKWDGSAWGALGSGMGGVSIGYPPVSALAVSGNDVYAGGYFTNAGSIAANYIAKWDGSAWSALGSGLNGGVSALAVSGGGLYAGGSFTTAGGKVSAYAAKAIIAPFYFITTNNSVGLTNGQFYFTLAGPAGSNAVIFASTNLQSWAPLVTNTLTGGSLNYTDTLATKFTRRFYRALLQP